MPVSVHALALNEATVNLEWNGQHFTVAYRPSVFTSKFQKDYLKVIKKTETDAESVAWWISRIVISWDIMGDDGQPLPLTEEWLADQDVVDVPFLWWLVGQINEDRRPKATTPNGAVSGDSSSLA